MEKLRRLEIKKLIKEFEFLESDLDLKLTTINENDEAFHREIDVFIENHPKLKFLLEEKKQYEINNSEIIQQNIDNSLEITSDDNYVAVNKDPKLKSLYRKIARSTHPDMIKRDNLKEIYLDAKKAYENDNLFSIISLCEKLNLPYNMSEEEITNLGKEIDKIKKRIKFLESTFTWQWVKKQDKSNEVILSYIKSQLIK